MKKTLIAFFLGAALGGLAIYFLKMAPFPTELEASVAQLAFKEIQSYAPECRAEAVIRAIQDFEVQRRPLKDEEALHEPLLDFEAHKLENKAAKALATAERYLQALKRRQSVNAVVDDRVYIEILREGTGERISDQDVVRIHFKEFNLEGVPVKDTGGSRPFAIPLAQTIKGFRLGMAGARVGETRMLYIHPEYGFGKMGRKPLNRLLIYEVTVVEKA